jgi:translocation and assembly module TamA
MLRENPGGTLIVPRFFTAPRRAALVTSVALLLPLSAAALDRAVLTAPGAPDSLTDRLRGASLVLSQRAEGVDDPAELLAAARADYARLVGALYGAGYYSGAVRIRVDGREAASIPPLNAPRRIEEIAITVEPGRPFTFSRAELTPLAAGTDLPEGFAVGERARSNVLQDAVGAGVDGWRAQGHAKAQPAGQRIVADHRQAQLDARIQLEPGPRLRFGALRISGQERMRESRIRAIAGLPEGEVFDPEAVARAANRLRRSGAFRSVALSEAERAGADGTLDIEAALVEQPLRRVGFGAEIASTEGAKVSAFWLHRNLNGGAERLRLEGEVGGIGAQVGGIDYRFAARLGRPASFTPDTTAFIATLIEREDERDYVADRARLRAGVTHIFSDTLSGEATLDLTYERVTDAAGRTNFATLSLPVALTWDLRDSERNPTEGYYLQGGVTPFLGLNGSTGRGAQVTFDARVYRALDENDRFVVAGRLQGGSVLGADIERTPRDLLFYSGGGGTVRGQPYQALGVDLPSGARSGGRSFIGASAEARVGLRGPFGAVVFADAGYIGADGFGNGDWHAGAGLGVRYDTGVGPIRLDVAAPVRGPNSGGVQIYVGIGQAF